MRLHPKGRVAAKALGGHLDAPDRRRRNRRDVHIIKQPVIRRVPKPVIQKRPDHRHPMGAGRLERIDQVFGQRPQEL